MTKRAEIDQLVQELIPLEPRELISCFCSLAIVAFSRVTWCNPQSEVIPAPIDAIRAVIAYEENPSARNRVECAKAKAWCNELVLPESDKLNESAISLATGIVTAALGEIFGHEGLTWGSKYAIDELIQLYTEFGDVDRRRAEERIFETLRALRLDIANLAPNHDRLRPSLLTA